MKRRKKGGAPRKAPGGLTKVLFLRVDRALHNRIEQERARKSELLGVTLSQADLVRMLLVEGLDRAGF
jgi:hypothetical protein